MANCVFYITFALGKQCFGLSLVPDEKGTRGKSGQHRTPHLRKYKLLVTVGVGQKKTTARQGKGEKVV